jgi:hypothetical protein
MPTPTVAPTTFSDHRIFGLDTRGEWRANLYNSPGLPDAGAMYSWTWAPTINQLASRLERLWEQGLSESEWDVLEHLELSMAEEVDCDECAATGVDPGGLSEFEPEECRACHGAKRMSIASVYAPRVAA